MIVEDFFKKRVRKDHLSLGLTYIAAVSFVLAIAFTSETSSSKLHGILGEPEKTATPVFFKAEAFEYLPIAAKAYIVFDILDKRIIAEHNATEVLPLASVTKIMTAVTAYQVATPNTLIRIQPQSIDGGYDLGLRKGQVWRLDELLKYTLTFSSNDGAYAVADTLLGRKEFVARMNTTAKNLGLMATFTDPAGLDNGAILGGKGSAYEVAKLMAIARRELPEVLEATTKTRSSVMTAEGMLSGIPNTNQSVNDLLGVEGSKTGYTDLAGGNLALIVDIALGRPVVIVVLGSTKTERFSDIEMLYKAVLESIK